MTGSMGDRMGKTHHNRTTRMLLAGLCAVLLACALPVQEAFAGPDPDWEKNGKCGPWDGVRLTEEEIKTVLKDHSTWWEGLPKEIRDTGLGITDVNTAPPGFTNLCGANLMGANLEMANLSGAYLHHTNFFGANLRQASFRGNYLDSTDLSEAELISADLRGTMMRGNTILQRADLSAANLVGASLPNADLRGGNLTRTWLQGTYLYQAKLDDVIFDPLILEPNSWTNNSLFSDQYHRGQKYPHLPDLDTIATANGLSQMLYLKSPTPLTHLKNALQEAGYKWQARQVSAAIKRSRDLNAMGSNSPLSVLGGLLGYVLLGVTCDYGASPHKALALLLGLMTLGTVGYGLILLFSTRFRGIVAVWHGPEKKGGEKPVTNAFFIQRTAWWQRLLYSVIPAILVGTTLGFTFDFLVPEFSGLVIGLITITGVIFASTWNARFARALVGGFWFSLVNTLRIGWRDLSLGTWLSRMQPRHYILDPRGKLRFVAGLQAILGLYLLVLLLLTYFQPLFEV